MINVLPFQDVLCLLDAAFGCDINIEPDRPGISYKLTGTPGNETTVVAAAACSAGGDW